MSCVWSVLSLSRGIESLTNKHTELDHIIIETTGLANPAPVIQTFFVDRVACSRCRVDGVITVVDSRHLDLHLPDAALEPMHDEDDEAEARTECHQQIAFADVVVLNKMDLLRDKSGKVPQAALEKLRTKVRRVNRFCKLSLIEATNSEVDPKALLDIDSFSLDKVRGVYSTLVRWRRERKRERNHTHGISPLLQVLAHADSNFLDEQQMQHDHHRVSSFSVTL